MINIDWGTVSISVVLFSLLLWLVKVFIETRLRASVKHEFDEKLEAVKYDLRKSEESLKASLRDKESKIEAVREKAIAALLSRQSVLDARKIQAVEEIWAAVIALMQVKPIAGVIGRFKFDELAVVIQGKPELGKTLWDVFGEPCKLDKLDLSGAAKARPFVTLTAWALFSAYSAILMQAVAKLTIFRFAMPPDILDKGKVADLVKAVLPHQESYVNEYGDIACYFLIDEVEQLLISELRGILSGKGEDESNIERLKNIIRMAAEVNETKVDLVKKSEAILKDIGASQ